MLQKISNYIFSLSPKKLAIYLVLGPLVLFLVHTVTTITFRNISPSTASHDTIVGMILGILSLFLLAIALLWLFWLRSVVFSVSASDLRIPRRWFNVALVLFIIYLLYNLCYAFIYYVHEDYRYLFYALNEFIGFGGLLLAYPIVCHYAGRAVYVKKHNEQATFVKSLVYTLLLIFIPVSIPFFHKYFSSKSSEKAQIIRIYAYAVGLCLILFVGGFLAAITGLV